MVLTCKQAPQPERATQRQGMRSLNVAQANWMATLSYLATTGTSFSNLRLVGWFVGHQKAT